MLALPAFDDLTDVDGDFTIADNPLLEQPHQVQNLTTVGGSFTLTDNLALFTVSQLFTLDSVGEDVVITGNTALPTSEADALANGITSVGGTVTVSGNGPG